MASIVNDPNGRKRIQVQRPDGRRGTIRLGEMSTRDAEKILTHVRALESAALSNTSLDAGEIGWLRGISAKLHKRIAANKLCAPRAKATPAGLLTVKGLVEAYIARRTDLKRGTIQVFEQARNHLTRFMGEEKPAAAVTIADAKDWRRALAQENYSDAYVGKMVRQARHVWRDAIERKILTENPFASVKVGTSRNPDRMRFIDRATIEKVIAAADDPQWKLLIALARYTGLRVPSEPLGLTWADVDLDAGRMIVRSPKTEHQGKAQRIVPIFPEVRTHLEAVFNRDAADGEVYVITRYRQQNANLRTQFERIITRAGVIAWPKLFQNLRSSCATELVERFPAHVVNAWLGHTEEVAQAHYRTVTDDHFAAAAGLDEKATQIPTLQSAANDGDDGQGEPVMAGIGDENEKAPGFPRAVDGPE